MTTIGTRRRARQLEPVDLLVITTSCELFGTLSMRGDSEVLRDLAVAAPVDEAGLVRNRFHRISLRTSLATHTCIGVLCAPNEEAVLAAYASVTSKYSPTECIIAGLAESSAHAPGDVLALEGRGGMGPHTMGVARRKLESGGPYTGWSGGTTRARDVLVKPAGHDGLPKAEIVRLIGRDRQALATQPEVSCLLSACETIADELPTVTLFAIWNWLGADEIPNDGHTWQNLRLFAAVVAADALALILQSADYGSAPSDEDKLTWHIACARDTEHDGYAELAELVTEGDVQRLERAIANLEQRGQLQRSTGRRLSLGGRYRNPRSRGPSVRVRTTPALRLLGGSVEVGYAGVVYLDLIQANRRAAR
jgi:hypothetical protein